MANTIKQFEISYKSNVVIGEGKTMADAVLAFVHTNGLGNNIEKVKAKDVIKCKDNIVQAWTNGGQSDRYKMYTGRYATIHSYKILS